MREMPAAEGRAFLVSVIAHEIARAVAEGRKRFTIRFGPRTSARKTIGSWLAIITALRKPL